MERRHIAKPTEPKTNASFSLEKDNFKDVSYQDITAKLLSELSKSVLLNETDILMARTPTSNLIARIASIDKAGKFGPSSPDNSVNGNEFVFKQNGFVDFEKNEGLKYEAYIREGNKLRPMTSKEFTNSEAFYEISKDVQRFNEASMKLDRPIKVFQVVCADQKVVYDVESKKLRGVKATDYDMMWQKTHLEDIAKKNNFTTFSRENLKNHENLSGYLDFSSHHKGSHQNDRGR